MTLLSDEGGVIEGTIYAVITILCAITLIIACGPIVEFIDTDLYANLAQEDTIYADSDSGWSTFQSRIYSGISVWEASFIIFIIISIIFMFMRAIRKQSYTQYR